MNRSLTVVMLIAFAGLAVGCREAPETPTTTGSAYHVDWPAARGKELYKNHCMICHGSGARGDGYNAGWMQVRPRDLTDAGRMGSLADDDLKRILREGGGAAGLSLAMPAFGATLDDEDIDYLAVYLRSLSGTAAQKAADTPVVGEE